ncbi:HlyD family type I secretion periplasmic adaptor subunit [Agaricicola taiwanensis]|uniref:Membrane fusion protein (MFP) family protein n=1 Tax=Agaricicola taiwanensis TaxID=591372 RepID=A0A8J2YKL8_9RHOB|nr:HlyD family type I secretion periplasmic adaptor subunit [Agaricicola taiwanensis]GGE48758.1 HlyD family type I secretion periplasmic adaptor subunit [Agaricicola taiwanensis]
MSNAKHLVERPSQNLPGPVGHRPPVAAPLPPQNFRSFMRLGYALIIIGLGGTVAWSALAKVQSAVVATGLVSVESSRKAIQHLEGGVVREVLVGNAEEVVKGQVLLRLSPVQSEAAVALNTNQLWQNLAMQARLEAEQQEAEDFKFPAELTEHAEDPRMAGILADQRRLWEERRRVLRNELDILGAQIQQHEERARGWRRQQEAFESQAKSYEEEVASKAKLVERGYFPANELKRLSRELDRTRGEIGEAMAEWANAQANVTEANLKMSQLRRQYQTEASSQLTEVKAKISDLRERLNVAQDVYSRLEVRAPQDGVVQNLQVHAPGAVVKPGDTIMELVPSNDTLVISARVLPTDIDSVQPGLEAEIRFPALPARAMPLILGTVENVSADTLVDNRTAETYFLAEVWLDKATMPQEAAEKLHPGMPADVMIATGERTVLEQLTRPLTDAIRHGIRTE